MREVEQSGCRLNIIQYSIFVRLCTTMVGHDCSWRVTELMEKVMDCDKSQEEVTMPGQKVPSYTEQ